MKRSFNDKVSDFLLKLLKPIVYIWMKFDTKLTITKDELVDFKREEPFVLLANHVYTFDVVALALPFKKSPIIVASQLLLTSKPMKILLKYVAKCIPKSKGEADIRTAKSLIGSIKKKYPVMIMPEGDTTFYGETGYIEYATAKLIKKLKVDLITGLFQGGYLSKPRWAISKRSNREVKLHYKVALSKEQIKELSVDEIYEVICKELYNNDYIWQKENMINYGGKNLALGLSDCLYVCPECESINSLKTYENNIECKDCNTKGKIDDYGFIHGFKFDNLNDWDKFQRNYSNKLKESTFESKGKLKYIYITEQKRESVGDVNLKYKDGLIHITGAIDKIINVDKMVYPVLTMRNNFSFEYEDKYYFIKIKNQAIPFLRVCQDKY